MFCKKCGHQNEDTATNCSKCNSELVKVSTEATKISNYLVQSILVTLLCCLPIGIPAIVFAAQVNGKVQGGDLSGAMASSKKAKMWCWIAFGVGLIFVILQIIITVIPVMLEATA